VWFSGIFNKFTVPVRDVKVPGEDVAKSGNPVSMTLLECNSGIKLICYSNKKAALIGYNGKRVQLAAMGYDKCSVDQVTLALPTYVLVEMNKFCLKNFFI
jgi:hypothetical protein